MTCSSCAARVERGISRMDGVESANVNFALEQLSVTYDNKETSTNEVKDKVESLGFSVAEKKEEFDIQGMTCSSCASRIEKSVSRMPGVAEANVNFALEKLHVTRYEEDVTHQEIIERVKKIGFDLTRVTDNDGVDRKEEEVTKIKRKLIFSAILTFPLLWTMVAHFSFLSFIYLPDLFMNPWFQLALATPVQFIVGGQFYKGAYTSLKNKSANMDVLVAQIGRASWRERVWC